MHGWARKFLDYTTMPGGRPTKYKPEYCEELVEFMAQGYPYECFAATIGVGRSTLYDWEKEHQEFSDAKKVGKEMTYKALLEKGLDSLHDPGTLNNTVWIFMMKNMCDWTDRKEVKSDNTNRVVNLSHAIDDDQTP